MSTIAQKIQTFILRIHNKNNLTDVQFSFEETNIHQKNTFEKKRPAHMDRGRLKTLDSNNAC